MARFGDLDTQYFDDAGDPLVNGKIYFYETGTTTPKTTYADVNLSVPNANPVILTAAGRQPNIFFSGVAKAILATSAGVQIQVRDPVGETASNFGSAWVASKNYNANDVVQGSDGNFYVALVSANINNNPVTTTGYWTFLYSVEWSSGTTYKEGSVVTYQSIVYQSLQDANLNKNPSTETAWWVPIQLAWSSTATYAANVTVIGSNGVLYVSQQAANTGNDPTSDDGTWWISASAGSATTAAALDAGLASVNYQGPWSLLTGALDTPASVSHNACTWLLLNDLADVTASEPGVTVDWEKMTGLVQETRTSNSAFVGVDSGKLIDFSGTFTQTFVGSVALGIGWGITLRNPGPGIVTLDPYSTETIDGVSTIVMYPGEIRFVYSDGSNLLSKVISPFNYRFTTSGTFYMPSGYRRLYAEAQGGGGGGAGGQGGAGNITGGGGGAGGSGYLITIDSPSPGSSHAVVCGAGGTAGAGGSGGAGTNGGAGQTSSLANIVSGEGGIYGQNTGTGGTYTVYYSSETYARRVISGSGGSSAAGLIAGLAGDQSYFGGGGGGSGGGTNGVGTTSGGIGRGRGKLTTAAHGVSGNTPGCGGGGGNSSLTTGEAGGNGYLGGGGGGGGAGSTTGGAGGAGGGGYVLVAGIV